MFGPLRLVRALTDEQIEAMGDPKRAPYAGLPTIEGAVQGGAFLCGPAEQIIERAVFQHQDDDVVDVLQLSHNSLAWSRLGGYDCTKGILIGQVGSRRSLAE